MQEHWNNLKNYTDNWPWYCISYGEKCYAFAVVSAFPLDEKQELPPAGTWLELHQEKDRVWVTEDGIEMLIDQEIACVERQNGRQICQFIASSWADAQKRYN